MFFHGIMAKTTTCKAYSFRISYWARRYLQKYHWFSQSFFTAPRVQFYREGRTGIVLSRTHEVLVPWMLFKKWLHHLLTSLSCLFFNVLFWGLPVLLSHIRAFKTGLGRCDAWASFRVQGRLPDGTKIAFMSEWGEMAPENDRSLLPVPFVLFRAECDYMF